MANFNNQLTGWEYGFTSYIKGLETNNEKLINKGIKIMNAIDPELTLVITAQEVTEEEVHTEVTVYHGTHEEISQFVNREVKNYDSIGTYFTSNKDYARLLYGKNVVEATIKLNNPLVVKGVTDCEEFDKVFFDNSLTNKSFDQINSLLLDKTYINRLKDKLITKGYDGIVFEESRIDLSKEDIKNHTVYIMFNADNISIQNKYEV